MEEGVVLVVWMVDSVVGIEVFVLLATVVVAILLCVFDDDGKTEVLSI